MSGPADPRRIERVMIVGGGTARWMAALALSRLVSAGMSVTLVESDEIGTVGVGEATIPPLLDFHAMVGIDEREFIGATGATFKLGIEFRDWRALGDRYFHPFGTHGRDVHGIGFHHLWLRRRQAGDGAASAIDDYCLSAVAARHGRFTHPQGDGAAVLASLGYAFHFDAGLYARFLRRRAEAAGVVRVEGRVDRVELTPGDGSIAAVTLAGGRRLPGDLFVDCSGFRSLLLGQALGVPFRSWRGWLPCDRALAVPTTSSTAPVPYTRATADKAGWRWRIPLRDRTGNGHVYSSDHVTDAAAEHALMGGLDGEAAAPPRQLRFEAGMRARQWERNCIAIGLSAGFLEPLESTSIHLAQSGIKQLMALFPDRSEAPAEARAYNRQLALDYERARDFVILHYQTTERDDSDFWNDRRLMAPPDSLAEKLELWQRNARLLHEPGELFSPASWVAVLIGQGVIPTGHDPLATMLPLSETAPFMQHLRGVIARTAEAMPGHGDYLERYESPEPFAGAAR